MITVRDWLKKEWESKTLRQIASELGVSAQSVRQWAFGFARPSLPRCRKIAEVMGRSGLVVDPIALHAEAVSFTAQARERLPVVLDEPVAADDTGTADNTVGPNT